MLRILGIDPGSINTGYGIVEQQGDLLNSVAYGVIQPRNLDLAPKLYYIQEQLLLLLDKHPVDEASIEQVFVNKNANSALKLGQARGCAMAACAMRGLPVSEYSPNSIKLAVVGRGHADKQQVQHMVKVLLHLEDPPQTDAADALATAICHAHSRNNPLQGKGYKQNSRRNHKQFTRFAMR
ncbi:MAG: crossover junction endodeoxyribonuclease RuvC [Candidatus Eutrophobiaceae bacterium]